VRDPRYRVGGDRETFPGIRGRRNRMRAAVEGLIGEIVRKGIPLEDAS